MPQAQPTLRVPWSHLCSALIASSIELAWESRFPPSQPFFHPQNLIKNFHQGAHRGLLVQDTGKTLSLFKMHHKQIFLLSQWSSHLRKHFATHLLECRCLIICLIYKPVYHKLTKDFFNKQRKKIIRCFNNHFMREKNKCGTKGFSVIEEERCKKNVLVVLEELRQSLGV